MSLSTATAMTLQLTCALIKPDAVSGHHVGDIIKLIEQNKFEIVCMQKVTLSKDQAETFYGVHKDRPFFGELVTYITSGPIIALALKKENAIQQWRDLMGATDPVKANVGTLRYMFGKDLSSNVVHGSDAQETAKKELAFFFPNL